MKNLYIAGNDSGQMTTDLWTEFLLLLVQQQRKDIRKGPLLFIFDGPTVHEVDFDVLYGSLSGKLFLLCSACSFKRLLTSASSTENERRQIYFLVFLPNTTLIWQPLDNGVFSIQKKNFRRLRKILLWIVRRRNQALDADAINFSRTIDNEADYWSVCQRTEGIFLDSNCVYTVRTFIPSAL